MKDFFKLRDNFALYKEVESIVIIDNGEIGAKYTFAIPTYKRSSDLDYAIQSVINQVGDIPYNILVVDNNPVRNDETEILMKKYASIKNLKYYKNTHNIGMTGNWNRLFSLCHTPYLIMLHDDDYLLSYFIKYIDEIIRKHPDISAINSNKEKWNGKMNFIEPKYSCPTHVIKHTVYTNYLCFSFKAPSGILLNVNDVKKIGGFDENSYPSADYALILNMLLKKYTVVSTTLPLIKYRICENTTSKEETQLQWMKIEYDMKDQLSDLIKAPRILRNLEHSINIKIRLRSLLKDHNKYVEYKGYKPATLFFLPFYKIVMFCYLHIYIKCISKIKI